MFYEEKVEGGILWVCSTPGGAWLRASNTKAEVIKLLYQLSDEERVSVFSLFCVSCGNDNPRCSCMRDE